ncbi:MAG: glycosyl hydrolase family 18 protein [Candidatus Paceibacterota bacterium]|jgi:spore germination protein YaaH
MNKAIKIIFFSLIFLILPGISLATDTQQDKSFEKIFYYSYLKSGVESFKQNASKIDVFAPQLYTLNYNLKVTGKMPADMRKIISENNTQVMPLIVQANFNQKLIHKLLISPNTQNSLINTLVKEAKKENYIGWQFDFEHMIYTDRDRYTKFVKKAHDRFKKENLILSVAAIARTDDDNQNTSAYKNWGGVFDYKKIAENSDFISIMAYDDPESIGPTASLDYVKSILTYLEDKVPPEKLSLGIPMYYWKWDLNSLKKVDTGSYSKLEILRKTYFSTEGFDENLGVAWLAYSNLGKNYKVWHENQKSFQLKYDLVKDKGLRGFSAWVLGVEDPSIWNIIPIKNI